MPQGIVQMQSNVGEIPKGVIYLWWRVWPSTWCPPPAPRLLAAATDWSHAHTVNTKTNTIRDCVDRLPSGGTIANSFLGCFFVEQQKCKYKHLIQIQITHIQTNTIRDWCQNVKAVCITYLLFVLKLELSDMTFDELLRAEQPLLLLLTFLS